MINLTTVEVVNKIFGSTVQSPKQKPIKPQTRMYKLIISKLQNKNASKSKEVKN